LAQAIGTWPAADAMIFHSVPTEEPDDCDGEDGSVMPAGHLHVRSLATLTDDATGRGEHTPSWLLIALGVCCLLSVVGIGASLAVLSRFATEASGEGDATAGLEALRAEDAGPLLALFSFGPSSSRESPTNAVLAWLAAALLEDGAANLSVAAVADATGAVSGDAATAVPPEPSDVGAAFLPDPPVAGPFVPDGGRTVRRWRPMPGKTSSPPRVFAHGEVAARLQRDYSLGPPRVRDLTGPPGSETPEEDVFLEIRALVAAVTVTAASLAHGGAGDQVDRPLDRAPRGELVLVSHPHHFPYLVVLSRAAGFEAAVLDPALLGRVPWQRFGCGPLGYGEGLSPWEGVGQEAGRLASYASALQVSDPILFGALQPVLAAANATLGFHRCVVGSRGGAGASLSPVAAGRACSGAGADPGG